MLNRIRHAAPRAAWASPAFMAGAVALAVLYVGNNLPSALYGTFRADLGFSALTQTLLYAIAVAVILPCLLVFGPLSDVVGRRVPMIVGLLAFLAGDALFASAQGVGWLFAARLAQGFGMGAATAAAQATLADSVGRIMPGDPARGHRRVAMTATACITFGLAVGPLLGGLLAQYAPAPLQLAFVVHAAAVVVALVAVVCAAPGRAAAAGGRWRPARLGVPADVRRTFLVASASSFLAWGVLGAFSAVLPSLVGDLLGTTNLALTASALALMIGTSGAAQLVFRRLRPLPAQAWGLGALALGLALLVLADMGAGAVVTVPAMLSTGVGHGLVYSGALREITETTPPSERGAVTSTYYVVSYLGLGAPVIGLGLLAAQHGLEVATQWVAVVIAVLCVLFVPLVFGELRRRPGSATL
ncbi:MFS transporter [Pseudonocardia sp. CA-142604]|uniref:MFS transporter n=1 Tax=Pseudonocardia sp. CA-142604 TaxID=3240024 RepID=UPI003D8BDE95